MPKFGALSPLSLVGIALVRGIPMNPGIFNCTVLALGFGISGWA
jgi:hypothetical protein